MSECIRQALGILACSCKACLSDADGQRVAWKNIKQMQDNAKLVAANAALVQERDALLGENKQLARERDRACTETHKLSVMCAARDAENARLRAVLAAAVAYLAKVDAGPDWMAAPETLRDAVRAAKEAARGN